jgi:hypothetical protein
VPSTPPVQHRTRFFDQRIPSLYAGKYTLTTQQSIGGVNTGDALPDRVQRFDVRGPRFAIAGDDVHACYPLPGSTGLYSQVLPHVTLTTPGVPWLRPLAEQEPSVPWLALLVFRERELPGDPQAIGQVDACMVRELLAGRLDSGQTLPGCGPEIEPEWLFADEVDLVCSTILVPGELFTAITPLPEEMAALAHVREGGPPDATRGATPPPDDEELKAVVVANRFPDVAGGMHVAHLVSFDGHEDLLAAGASVPAEGVRLVSLRSWVFESEPDSGTGFGDLVQNLATDRDPLLRLPVDAPADPTAAQREALGRIATGATALPQRLASGERTAAFYRGPLAAAPAQALPDPVGGARRESGDEALVYLEQYGVYDTGYASAFAVGRALALADPEFRTQLLAWRKAARSAARRLLTHPELSGRAVTADTASLLKRDLARDAFDKLLTSDGDGNGTGEGARGQGCKLARALAGAGADVAAGRRRTPAPRTSSAGVLTAGSLHTALARAEVRKVITAATATELDPVTDWLDRLALLEMIPFEHLVPDERMLPGESIRFFFVDPGWVRAAVDGALSIGVGHTLDADLNELARGVRPAPACGVLLHSDLVEGWPDTIYTAFRDNRPVEPVRTAQVGSHVMMLLFPQVIDTFTAAEPPQGIHFGFGDLGTIELRKITRPDVGTSMGEFPDTPGDDRFSRFLRPGSHDVLNIAGTGDPLLPALAQAHNVAELSSAQFALQMVKAPQLQIFVRP